MWLCDCEDLVLTRGVEAVLANIPLVYIENPITISEKLVASVIDGLHSVKVDDLWDQTGNLKRRLRD